MTDDNDATKLTAEEAAFVDADNLIQAVRSYRYRVGVDLGTAKRAVEQRARERGWKPWSERTAREPTPPLDEVAVLRAALADRDRQLAEAKEEIARLTKARDEAQAATLTIDEVEKMMADTCPPEERRRRVEAARKRLAALARGFVALARSEDSDD